MALSRGMTSGVSGIQSLQTAFDVTGNNIANVSTNGFKASRTTFRDVYYQTLSSASDAGNGGGSNPSQIGYGSQMASVDVMNTRGGFVSTGLGTDCYIDGEGYFTVQDASGNKYLTQIGTFSFDGSGNLVDGNKNLVLGYGVTDYNSSTTVGGLKVDFGKSNNLNTYKVNVVYNAVAASKSTAISANPDTKTITVTYTPEAAHPKLEQADLKTALQGTWTWKDTAGNVVTDPTGITPANITVGGAATDTVADGSAGSVESAANFGTALKPIANTFGTLKGISIGADGIVTGQDTKGVIQTVGKIALANVSNPNALTFDGNSYFSVGKNTGAIVYGGPGEQNTGKLKTGGLAGSNVDLATEFSNMIVTQRAYQANSKIITVSDEMLETLVNMKR